MLLTGCYGYLTWLPKAEAESIFSKFRWDGLNGADNANGTDDHRDGPWQSQPKINLLDNFGSSVDFDRS